MDAELPNNNCALLLYAATLVLETPVMLLRLMVAWAVAALALFVTGHPIAAASDFALIGLWPTVWSVSALIPSHDDANSRWILAALLGVTVVTIIARAPQLAILLATATLSALISPWATGWWWQARTGGREPSTRERNAYNHAIQTLTQPEGPALPLPANWFVLDIVTPEAAACGHTLMLTRGMLEHPQLPSVHAHELGHLHALDARIAAAINRLIIHPLHEPHPDQQHHKHETEIGLTDDPIQQTIVAAGALALTARFLLKWCRGGLGLWLLRPLWGRQWRANEYAADHYAASLDQANDLADFLETNALIYDQPVPLTWLTAHTHPPTELRIDRLHTYAQDCEASGNTRDDADAPETAAAPAEAVM